MIAFSILGALTAVSLEIPNIARSQSAPGVVPLERAGHAMAYDSVRQTMVLFGGSRSYLSGGFWHTDYLGDTWERSPSGTWSLVSESGPSPRGGTGMVYDSARRRVVLFGGYIAAYYYRGDTWEWDGNTWAQQTTSGPAGRFGHAMAYDSARERVVLTGGLVADRTLAVDIWEWDGASWTKSAGAYVTLTPTPSPTPSLTPTLTPTPCIPQDHGGADWTLGNGDRVSGQHFNVGHFVIPSGVEVTVNRYTPNTAVTSDTGRLLIEAQTIRIAGTLNATGAGFTGSGGGGGLSGYPIPPLIFGGSPGKGRYPGFDAPRPGDGPAPGAQEIPRTADTMSPAGTTTSPSMNRSAWAAVAQEALAEQEDGQEATEEPAAGAEEAAEAAAEAER